MTYFYKTDDMEKNLAGAAYSSAAGAWVTGERLIFGKMRMPAGTRSGARTPTRTSSSAIASPAAPA